MGYPTISHFDSEFIRRTLENLNAQYPNEYTQLVNSLFGLIIVPRQWIIQERRDLPFTNNIVLDMEQFHFLNGHSIISDEYQIEVPYDKFFIRNGNNAQITFGTLLDNLRHSIAHQSFMATKNEDLWEGILFRTYRNDADAALWDETFRFQVYLTMTELRILTNYIAAQYLNEI